MKMNRSSVARGGPVEFPSVVLGDSAESAPGISTVTITTRRPAKTSARTAGGIFPTQNCYAQNKQIPAGSAACFWRQSS